MMSDEKQPEPVATEMPQTETPVVEGQDTGATEQPAAAQPGAGQSEAANDQSTAEDAAAAEAPEAAQAFQASTVYARAMAQKNNKPAEAPAGEEAAASQQTGAEEIPIDTAAETAAAAAGAAPAAEGDLAAQVADMKDRLLRQMAETENLRNRMKRDVEDAGKYGVTKFARDMLTVSDNLRRAIDSVPEEGRDAEPLKTFMEGVMLTERELLNSLEKHQIAPINPEVGEKFDPNMHEAMFEAPVPGAPAGSVIQVMEIGYRIHDRLLRPARVGVAKAG